MAQKRKRNKRHISRVLLLVLLVIAAVVAYLVWDGYFKDKSREEGDGQQGVEQVDEKKEAVEEKVKEDVGEEKENDEGDEGGKKVVQYEGDDPNKTESVSGVVTYAGVSGNKLMIRVNIDQFLGSGQCNLSLIRDGASVYDEVADVVGSVATSTCEGFDVPVGSLESGTIEIRIEVIGDNKRGVIMSEVRL